MFQNCEGVVQSRGTSLDQAIPLFAPLRKHTHTSAADLSSAAFPFLILVSPISLPAGPSACPAVPFAPKNISAFLRLLPLTNTLAFQLSDPVSNLMAVTCSVSMMNVRRMRSRQMVRPPNAAQRDSQGRTGGRADGKAPFRSTEESRGTNVSLQ